jgi:hypothetical protein
LTATVMSSSEILSFAKTSHIKQCYAYIFSVVLVILAASRRSKGMGEIEWVLRLSAVWAPSHEFMKA